MTPENISNNESIEMSKQIAHTRQNIVKVTDIKRHIQMLSKQRPLKLIKERIETIRDKFGAKLYPCNFCSKIFKEPISKSSHVKIHINKKQNLVKGTNDHRTKS